MNPDKDTLADFGAKIKLDSNSIILLGLVLTAVILLSAVSIQMVKIGQK